MIDIACRLFLPADGGARVLLLSGAGWPTGDFLEGYEVTDQVGRGPFDAILRLPGASHLSSTELGRVVSGLRPGGSLLWIDRRGGSGVVDRTLGDGGDGQGRRRTFVAGRSGFADESASWVTPLPAAAKIDLLLEAARPWMCRLGLSRLDRDYHRFTLLTRNGEVDRSWLGSLLAAIERRGSAPVGDSRLGQVRLTANGVAVAQIGRAEGPAWALKVLPEDASLLERHARQRIELEHLRARADLPSEILGALPRLLESARFRGRPYCLEPWLAGVPCTVDMYSPRRREDDVDRGIEWITRLHRLTRAEAPPATQTAEDAATALRTIESAVDSPVAGLRERLVDYVADRTEALRPPSVYGHGDFWLGNILRDPSGAGVTAVLDWDLASPQSPPLVDILHLLATRKGLLRGFDREGFLLRLWGGNPASRDQTRLARYTRALELPPECAGVLSVRYWLHYMRHLAAHDEGRTAWFAAAYRRAGAFLASTIGPGLDRAVAQSLRE